jgi:hypothetical protein
MKMQFLRRKFRGWYILSKWNENATDYKGLSLSLEYVSSPPKYLQSLKLYSLLVHFVVGLVTLRIWWRYICKILVWRLQALESLNAALPDDPLNELFFGQNTFQMLQGDDHWRNPIIQQVKWCQLEALPYACQDLCS